MDKIEKIRQELENFVKSKIPYGKGGYGDMLMIATHFYELGKQAKKDAPEGLDKAALKYAEPYISTVADNVKWAFKAGAEWQKSQMFKDAFVDNYVVDDGRIDLEGDPLPSLDPIILLPYPQFMPGDKVRIVVLKVEEE